MNFNFITFQMSRIYIKYYLLIILSTFCFFAEAQESIYSEINYSLLDKLIDAAKTNYPLMKSTRIRLLMAQDNVKKTSKGVWYDFFSFSMSYSPTNTISIANYVLTGYQFGFSLNFATLLQKPYLLKDAKNQLMLTQLDKDNYEANLEYEVKSRYFKYLESLTMLKTLTKSTVDIEASFKQLKYKFEKAEESFDNYNKGLISVTQQKQSIISAEGALIMAKYSLEEIVCKKLEDFH